MTKDDVLFGYRQQLFAEAARTSVSAACRMFGVHRSTYYAWSARSTVTASKCCVRVSAGGRRCLTSSPGWSRSAS